MILAAIVAAFTMAIAAPAQAHAPNTAKGWGLNSSGQLGDGTTTGPEKCGVGPTERACGKTPGNVTGLSGVKAVAGGAQDSLALVEDGTVAAWGLGSDVPAAVKELSGVVAIADGGEHRLALLANGTVRAWGSNGSGELGDGTTSNSAAPVAVCAVGTTSPCSEESKQLKEVIAVAAGGEHSLALLSNGTVVAWGSNEFGQLGDGTNANRDVPIAVKGLSEEVTAIAGGSEHSLALLKNHTVVAWGNNSTGQLGNGGETSSDVPVGVSGLTGVAAISAGGRLGDSLALLSSGTVKAWGNNKHGQLGEGASTGPETCGTTPCSKIPVAVCAGSAPGPCPTGPFLSGVTAVSSGKEHSLALLSNGSVKAWGDNENGQLGDGTSTGPEPCSPFADACSTTPVEVSNLVDASGIAGGGSILGGSGHSLAFGPPPTVAKVEPDAGLEGKETSVTISGEDFTGASAVKFGSYPAVSFTVNSDTSISAVAPAEPAGIADVTVTTTWGTSATTPADHFTYVKPGAAPTVTRLRPKKGPAAGGTSVLIKGTGFSGVTAVKFGSVKATSFTVNSAGSITAISPAGKAKEKVAITVTTPNGTSSGTITTGDGFKYVG